MKRLKKAKSMRVAKNSPRPQKPAISVVVIALNEEKVVAKNLQSLKGQEFTRPFEIILADGGSTDCTVKIAKKYCSKIIVEKRMSGAFERNAGALLARAPIIAFSDSDSIIPKNWLSAIHKAFQKNPKAVGVWGPIYFSDTGFLEKLLSRVAMHAFCMVQVVLGKFAPASGNFAFKKKAFFGLDGFDTRHITCEDHEFLHRVSKKGKVLYVPGMEVMASARRVKKMGYLNYLKFQLSNINRFYSTGKGSREYENIR